MNTQHTPGPWVVTDSGHGVFSTDKQPAHKNGIIAICDAVARTPEENEANAHLIASAPDLLLTCEALGAFTRDLLKLVTPEQIREARLTARMLKLNDQAFSAIAKARGE